MAKLQNLDQKRAAHALKCVGQVGKGDGKEYRSLVKSAPANIQISGLGQTLAYWRSKNKHFAKDLYEHVSRWVCPQMGWVDNDDLLTKITQCSTSEYRRATIEAMVFLNWLRRFAEAELGDGE